MTRRPPRLHLFPYTTLFRSLPKQGLIPRDPPHPRREPAERMGQRRPLRHGGEGHAGQRDPDDEPRDDRQHDPAVVRSEEHTSELQSPCNLVCRLLLEKKKKNRGREKRSSRPRRPPARRQTHSRTVR